MLLSKSDKILAIIFRILAKIQEILAKILNSFCCFSHRVLLYRPSIADIKLSQPFLTTTDFADSTDCTYGVTRIHVNDT